MPFVVFALILAGAAIIFVLYPHLRVLAGAVFVLFGLVLGYLFFDQTTQAGREQALVTAADLTLSDVTLTEGSRFQKLSGRVTHSGADGHLRSFDVRVQLLDCAEPDTPLEDCTIIGDDRGIARVDVPAGQSRDFEATLGFSGRATPKGTLRWSYEVEDIRATEPPRR